jgi:hypothetical protein
MSNNKKLTAKLKDETPPPPLEPQQAKDRALFIRDNIKIVSKLRDEGKTFDEMKEAAPEFANNFPHLFILVTSNEPYDKNTLDTMLIMIDKMAQSNLSQHDASIKVGSMLMNKYAKPANSS